MKHILFAVAALVVVLLFGGPANAAQQCGIQTPLGLGCTVGIPSANFLPVKLQLSPVTCWAASFSNLLMYFGIQLSEPDIVASTTGTPKLADPVILNAMLNAMYLSPPASRPFSVSAQTTDAFWHTANQISNFDIIQALIANIPVFYADANHAMIVLQMTYVPGPLGPQIIDIVVADPALGIVRHAGQNEISATYAAIISVH